MKISTFTRFLLFFMGRQLCWKDHLDFSCHAICKDVYMDVCTDVGFSSTSKVNICFSNENAMTNFRETWYVGSGARSTTHVVCRDRMHIFNTSFAYLF